MTPVNETENNQPSTKADGESHITLAHMLAAFVLLVTAVMLFAPHTPTVTLVYLVALLALIGAAVGDIRLWASKWPTQIPLGHCEVCQYNLTGNVSGICPECGTACTAARTTATRARPYRVLALAVGLSLPVFVGYIGLYNIGLPFGYYGELNRMKGRLARVPNVRIDAVRCNRDVTLEEVTFDITIDGQHRASLYFHEFPNRWTLFDTANGVLLRRRRPGASGSWESVHYWWWIDLGPNNAVSQDLQCELRTLDDVLRNFGAIIEMIEETPTNELDERFARPPALGLTRYVIISIP